MPSSEVDRLKQERERLRREHAAGASGLRIARAISDATDAAIVPLWERLGGPKTSALVALGGYGRRELSPSSDIDLAVLQPKRKDPLPAVKALAYELWDGGFELGYASYTPKEAIRLSKERLDSATTFLDVRLLAGDESLFKLLVEDMLGWARKSRGRFVARIAEATQRRRSETGDVGAELEPNIKEGRGGLRDLTTLSWIAKLDEPIVDPTNLGDAADFLHRIRNELHYLTGRRTDVLSMQYQPKVATSLIGERGDVPAEDLLMRSLYEHARNLAFSLDSTLRVADPRPTGGGKPRMASFANEFASLLDPSQPVWSDAVREAFMSGLRSPDKARPQLEELDRRGLLVAALPEWAGIRCLPQRNVYHRYAVDIHTFEVVRALGSLFESGDDLAHRVANETRQDMDVLLLAALLHDIGKGEAEDHAVRGEELAQSALARIGIDETAADEVSWLVRHHLMLSEAAARRDIGDERFLVELSDKVGSERRLRMLYLLTVADGIATGPAGWGPWKATLVNRLFTGMTHVLENGGLVGGVAADEAVERTEKLRAALDAYPSETIESHLANMPRAWLINQPFEALIHQSSLMLEPLAPDDVRISAIPQSEAGIWETIVIARDRPGLFSKIAGGLALHGLNVVGAEVYTREDGLALEIFRLEALGDEEHRFERFLADTRKALKGRLALDVRLAEKRRDYAWRTPKGRQDPPRVVVDNMDSDFYTVIEVHASDRIGLLYTITRALADMELDIHMAKIATYAEDVVDVFYARDLDGQKITDPEHIAEIDRTILHRLLAEA